MLNTSSEADDVFLPRTRKSKASLVLLLVDGVNDGHLATLFRPRFLTDGWSSEISNYKLIEALAMTR